MKNRKNENLHIQMYLRKDTNLTKKPGEIKRSRNQADPVYGSDCLIQGHPTRI